MITEEFVIIPIEVLGIVPYGIGSAKIERDGKITVTLPSGDFFGREVDEMVREGKVDSLRLIPHSSKRV